MRWHALHFQTIGGLERDQTLLHVGEIRSGFALRFFGELAELLPALSISIAVGVPIHFKGNE
jgi:hypothetical protein